MERVTKTARVSPDGTSLTVRVPLAMRRRGGRKAVISPAGEQQVPHYWAKLRSGVDDCLVQTLAQAFRWQQLLNEGRFATLGDLAGAMKLDRSFVARVMKLTLLAPDIVEAILDGRQSANIRRQNLLHKLPLAWSKQQL